MKGVRSRGSIGDVNPIKYGGGYILSRAGESSWVEYFEGLEGLDECGDLDDSKVLAQTVTLYRVDLERCGAALLSSLSWVDFAAVEASCGYGIDNPYGSLSTLCQRANLVQDVAGYYGWHELDNYPLQLTLGELIERWKGFR